MLTPADDGGAAPDGPVAVISHRFWRQHFGGADDVVGRQLTVQRVPFTIVGVMPPGFFGVDVGRMTDVMLPFAAEPLIRGQESRLTSAGTWWLEIMVRLKPGQSLDQANAALRSVQPQIRAATLAGWAMERSAARISRRAAHPGAGRDRQSVAAQALRDAARSRWSWPWGSCCSSRARTSPACCSRGRWRGGASSACGWRSAAHAGGSRGCSSPRA